MPPATPDPSHYDGQDLEALGDLPRYTGWILEHFATHLHGRVIEVGAGIGNVSARYVDRVQEAVLVEPARNLHHKLQERLGHLPQVTTTCALLHELDPALTREPFDAAIMVNVLEHIDDDAAVLRQLYDLLRPGGAVLLFVPALPWLYGSLDALVHHVRRYTREDLAAKLRAAGFGIGKVRYFDALGVLPWFVAGRVVKQKRFDPAAATLYDRVGVPLTRAVEQWIEPPAGKSLVAVGFKPLGG
jgi:SAM-dependent methyltransferase